MALFNRQISGSQRLPMEKPCFSWYVRSVSSEGSFTDLQLLAQRRQSMPRFLESWDPYVFVSWWHKLMRTLLKWWENSPMREREGCSAEVIHSILLMFHPCPLHNCRCWSCCVERHLELGKKDSAILGLWKGISCAYVKCLKMWPFDQVLAYLQQADTFSLCNTFDLE